MCQNGDFATTIFACIELSLRGADLTYEVDAGEDATFRLVSNL